MDTDSKPVRKEENNMLTPEEIREILLPVDVDDLIARGVDSESDTLEEGFYTDANGIYHYQRVMDKETGMPFNGLMINFSEDDPDRIEGYAQMKEGYPLDDVKFYPSGALYLYERHDDTERYQYIWHENGALKSVLVWNRRDERDYARSRFYDETGRLSRQAVRCEIKAIYNPDAADSPFDFTFHENGEFRKITLKAPTADDFYLGIELDPDGYPVRIAVNPHFTERTLGEALESSHRWAKTFDEKNYRVQNGDFQYFDQSLKTWRDVNGNVLFRDSKHGDRILSYYNGIQTGGQTIYYPNGQIKESFCIDSKGEYRRHIHWYPNGLMREATVYSHYDVMLRVTFDDKGKQRTCQLNAAVFDKVYNK